MEDVDWIEDISSELPLFSLFRVWNKLNLSLHFLTSDRLRAFSLKPLWRPKDQVLQIYLNEKKKLFEDFFVVEIVVKGKKYNSKTTRSQTQ